MKKTFVLSLLMVLTILFTACNVEDPIVDSRDAFVGQYNIVVTGSVTFTSGTSSQVMPINDVGEITITKDVNSSALVNVSGYYNAKATINGNAISIDRETVTQTQEGITTQMTLTHSTGVLQGNTLLWESNVLATSSTGSVTVLGGGKVQNVATKK